MRPGAITGLVGVLSLAGVHSAAAQSSSDQVAAVPGKALYFGVAGEGLISRSPGLAVAGVMALEWKHLLITAELAVGETFSGWDMFYAGAQAGAVLLSRPDTPYFLAGIEYSRFVDFIGERDGRADRALTGEAGYVFRRPNGGRQVWLGIRGIVPIASHVYSDAAPQLPVAVLIVKLLL